MKYLLLVGIAAASLAAALPASAQQSTSTQQQSSASSSAQQGKSAASMPSHDEIMHAQQALDGKGFDAGKSDGIMGPQTRRALARFQQDQKLPRSGHLDNRTLAALGMSDEQPSSGTTGQKGQGSPAPANQQHGGSPQSNQGH